MAVDKDYQVKKYVFVAMEWHCSPVFIDAAHASDLICSLFRIVSFYAVEPIPNAIPPLEG